MGEEPARRPILLLTSSHHYEPSRTFSKVHQTALVQILAPSALAEGNMSHPEF
jgi:hypothetical protein